MAQIGEYPEAESLVINDIFLLDGDNGTKHIQAQTLAQNLFGMLTEEQIGQVLNVDSPDALYNLLDPLIPIQVRRNIWRGKNLGAGITNEQWIAIHNGKFHGLWLGDYWEIDGRIWRIVDFDYWYGSGNSSGYKVYSHHLVLMPDKTLYNEVMNDSETVVGGYVGSKMYTSGLDQAKQIIFGTFQEAHIQKHMEYLNNGVTDGRPATSAWFETKVELPNEVMIAGHFINTPMSAGSGIYAENISIANRQLSAFKHAYDFMLEQSGTFRLRDVVSGAGFADANKDKYVGRSNANISMGVRPVFGIFY